MVARGVRLRGIAQTVRDDYAGSAARLELDNDGDRKEHNETRDVHNNSHDCQHPSKAQEVSLQVFPRARASTTKLMQDSKTGSQVLPRAKASQRKPMANWKDWNAAITAWRTCPVASAHSTRGSRPNTRGPRSTSRAARAHAESPGLSGALDSRIPTEYARAAQRDAGRARGGRNSIHVRATRHAEPDRTRACRAARRGRAGAGRGSFHARATGEAEPDRRRAGRAAHRGTRGRWQKVLPSRRTREARPNARGPRSERKARALSLSSDPGQGRAVGSRSVCCASRAPCLL